MPLLSPFFHRNVSATLLANSDDVLLSRHTHRVCRSLLASDSAHPEHTDITTDLYAPVLTKLVILETSLAWREIVIC